MKRLILALLALSVVGAMHFGHSVSTAQVPVPAKVRVLPKGTKVSWFVDGTRLRGSGRTISDTEDGHVLVAVDGGAIPGIPSAYHMVIYCTVTWLTVEP